jgi:hypothetical protein
MNGFTWNGAQSVLEGFGGTPIGLYVAKTGLPFFDALRLYGAIDLYIGLREDVSVSDRGHEWLVHGHRRQQRLKGRDESSFQQVWSKSKPSRAEFCKTLQEAITRGTRPVDAHFVEAGKKWDAVLQDGIRGVAARTYETLQSGQTSKKECKAYIPLSHAILAFAGKARVESIGQITFLPIFEGQIDLSKVVSPLRAWIGMPNVLCAQALALLALKTSLFVEGYQERLKAVVFNTNFSGQRSDNYSGVITVDSTAVGKMRSASFAAHIYRVFRAVVGRAWKRQGRSYQTTDLTTHALGMAYWLMQPVAKHLASMITSQERLRRERLQVMFTSAEYVKEVFAMSYGDWKGDHEGMRKFARAVASGIYYARMKDQKAEDRSKAWYDEVTMLRSAPSAKAFLERAMILIEQGHREDSRVGTGHWDQAFDPQSLLSSVGNDRVAFETFRDLFRMYLVQESTYKTRDEPAANAHVEASVDEENTESKEEENE